VAITTLVDKAQVFRALHRAGTPLVLPNAWDVVSARIVAAAGAAAIATTSAGVVWSLGYRDGDHLDRGRALDAIARVAAAVDLPVTADIESGYAADPSGVAETVRGVVAAGAAGINLQDSFRPINEQVERIAAARTAADATGVPLFINARIDTHRLPTSESGAWLRETVNRAEAYMAAGADGVFGAMLETCGSAGKGVYLPGDRVESQAMTGVGAPAGKVTPDAHRSPWRGLRPRGRQRQLAVAD
jgi:2-methylisocitrate lyase-like PEP mutase family enzyme